MSCKSCYGSTGFRQFSTHFGGITGPTGTYVRLGTAGTGNVYGYKETKIYEAQKVIEDTMFKLGLSGSMSNEVKAMIDKITEGEYGQGSWFPVLTGACAYVVMRKDNKTLPISEIPWRGQLRLAQCLIKWFVTTGRRPIPVVAAVLVFVATLNQVDVKINELAKELHVAVATCKKRYKELLVRLVEVARVLPWGEDVTTKNIINNAPYVIQYMELKSMEKRGENNKHNQNREFCLDDLIDQCLSKDLGYGYGSYDVVNDSQYFE
ncbi:general transcription factor [Lithospermum erythrorhizon]|uniref:General transcription factor n=1 Tax=Lithospermum erythrorhizon TaxID=34254 RepID=A0AAV3P8Y1_LITER